MTYENALNAEYLATFKINLHEPFSDFLMGSPDEKNFSLSLLDVVRFAGHACPSMTGAFLMTRAALLHLYPNNEVAVRGHIEIDIPDSPMNGAIGPIANVFSFITGAWAETGFGGLQGGLFARRNLLRFNSSKVFKGSFLFTRTDNGKSVVVTYQPGMVPVDIDPNMPFQLQWRTRIRAILERPDLAVSVVAAN